LTIPLRLTVGSGVFMMKPILYPMQNKSSNSTRKDGSFRLEAILFLMILAVLAFLAIPVFNTLQEYRKTKAVSSPSPASEVQENNSSKNPLQ